MKKFLFIFFFSISTLWSIELGKMPSGMSLEGSSGGLVSGGAWHSATLKDKVHVLFYVDPDEKDLNESFADALKAQQFDNSSYASVVVINMAATWKPNVILEAVLESKQKKFPRAIYVKDKKKVLVKEWGLVDDSSVVLVLDKDAKVLYHHTGKLDESEISKVLSLIKEAM